MNFGEAVGTCLRNFATFRGRARRSEFWNFVLFQMILSLAAGILDAALFGSRGIAPMNAALSLLLLLPTLAAGARRLHDGGRSAWWLLIGLVPFIGWLVLVYFYIDRGQDGPNRFGPDPRAPAVMPAGPARPWSPPGGPGGPWSRP